MNTLIFSFLPFALLAFPFIVYMLRTFRHYILGRSKRAFLEHLCALRIEFAGPDASVSTSSWPCYKRLMVIVGLHDVFKICAFDEFQNEEILIIGKFLKQFCDPQGRSVTETWELFQMVDEIEKGNKVSFGEDVTYEPGQYQYPKTSLFFVCWERIMVNLAILSLFQPKKIEVVST